MGTLHSSYLRIYCWSDAVESHRTWGSRRNRQNLTGRYTCFLNDMDAGAAEAYLSEKMWLLPCWLTSLCHLPFLSDYRQDYSLRPSRCPRGSKSLQNFVALLPPEIPHITQCRPCDLQGRGCRFLYPVFIRVIPT
jgi:hypothetical protein